MSSGSLRVRLLLAASISIIVALALAAFGLAYLFERHVERWLDAQLEVQLNDLIAGVSAAPAGLDLTKPPSDPRFEQPLSGLYWQAERKPGGPVLRSRSLWDFQIALPDIPVDDAVHQARLPGASGSTLHVLMRHVEPPNAQGGTILVAVALDAGELRAAVWRFARALVPLLLLVGALLLAAAYAQVTVGLRPLSAMRGALAGIKSGARKRLSQNFPDEVRPLAGEIDSLLDARERQVATARAQAADLAHGLKTHLQVLAGEAAKLKGRNAVIGAEIEMLADQMQRHVDRHLARARLAPPDLDMSANIAEIVERVVGVVRRTPSGERLDWSSTVPSSLAARMDPDDLAEALGNLIENAAQHACSKVAVSAKRDREWALLTVFDDGSGIAASEQREALKRGRRLDTSGPGTGLGLAIVADIAEAFGATLTFDDLADGFSVTFRMPLASTASPSRKASSI